MAIVEEAAKEATPDTEALVSSFIVGGSVPDVAELGRPKAAADAAVVAAEREVGKWAAIREALPTTIAAKAADLQKAREDVERAGLAVVGSEADAIISDALQGYAEAEADLLRRATALKVLHSRGLIPEPHAADVEFAIRNRSDFLLTKNFAPTGFESSEAARAWARAFEALKTDANAPLPGAKL